MCTATPLRNADATKTSLGVTKRILYYGRKYVSLEEASQAASYLDPQRG